MFAEQQLAADTIPDNDTTQKKGKQLYADYIKSKRAINAYNMLKRSTDVLISQMEADLTIANKKKDLKNLDDLSPWYKNAIKDVKGRYTDFKGAVASQKLSALSVSDVTGIFSAVVTVITSARDYRAQMITTICTELEGLRLTDAYDIMNGNSSSSSSTATPASSTKGAGKHAAAGTKGSGGKTQ